MRVMRLVTVILLAGTMAARAADTGTDPAHKYAWGENVGWANAGPTMHTLEEIHQNQAVLAARLLAIEARLNSDGKHATSGDMVLIPAGSFAMGDAFDPEGGDNELPVHTVTVSAFYMDTTEVTKAKWDAVYTWGTSHGYSFDNAGSGKATNHPVHTVNWYDCIAWANARSQFDGFTPCYTNTIQHARANYYASSSYSYDRSTGGYHPDAGTTSPFTMAVGSFAPNGYGLCDMAGNLYEWCWDRYLATYYTSSPGTDPRGPASGSNRVRRGGSWGSNPSNCRVASRNGSSLGNENSGLGFRLVRAAQ